MCFDLDSRPPALPAGAALPRLAGAAGAETLELTSADGTRFSAALTQADPAIDPAVVILPDVRGLYRFYAELTERFAEAGHHAIAIDYFGRTAGLGPRSDDFEYTPHMDQVRVEQIQADAAAAIAALRERTGATSFVTVGFCFGGMQSFLAGMNGDLALDGVVGFYAALDGSRRGMPSPKDHAADVRTPLLGLFGGADQAIPTEQVDAFDRDLEAAGVEHEVVTYPGAPHSFFDRKHEEFAEACDDAWRRVLSFLQRIGAGVAA